MKKANRTFQQILLNVADRNLQTLMTRARVANRLAKTAAQRRTKNRAYKIKVNALAKLKQNFPDKVTVRADFKHGSAIVLVEVAARNFGLHAPASDFGLNN